MSQTVKALIQIRELVLSGELAPGERLGEVVLGERLDVSRTPIRTALVKLSEDGLVERLPGGGYIVRAFTERDIHDAIHMRGMIEGMAARLAAERGISDLALSKLAGIVAGIDEVLVHASLTDDDIAAYLELNDRFHRQLIALAESFVVERMQEHIVALPFASPNAFVIANTEMDQSWKVFFVAQEQHGGIVEAIENREGMRAESLAREHALLALRTLKTTLKTEAALHSVPGHRLIANILGE